MIQGSCSSASGLAVSGNSRSVAHAISRPSSRWDSLVATGPCEETNCSFHRSMVRDSGLRGTSLAANAVSAARRASSNSSQRWVSCS